MASFADRGTFRPFIRGFIRQGIRQGESPQSLIDQLRTDYEDERGYIGGIAPSSVQRIANQEARRQYVIDRIEAMDKRRRTNLHAIVGCGKGEIIQTRISIQWRDEQTGTIRHFGHTTTLANTGRLMDILNPALAEAVQTAIGRGYSPPGITSSMLTGSTRYRLEYVECVGS